ARSSACILRRGTSSTIAAPRRRRTRPPGSIGSTGGSSTMASCWRRPGSGACRPRGGSPRASTSSKCRTRASPKETPHETLAAAAPPPILPILRETAFLDVAFAAAGKQVTNPENPTVFRIMASSDQLYQTYAVAVADKLGAKRIAFLGPNDELGKNDAQAIK